MWVLANGKDLVPQEDKDGNVYDKGHGFYGKGEGGGPFGGEEGVPGRVAVEETLRIGLGGRGGGPALLNERRRGIGTRSVRVGWKLGFWVRSRRVL